jgi:CO/xanthine dehydrogenase Mo-binding subunit
VLVMTHRNAPPLKPTPLFMSASKAAGGDDLSVMQDDLIHWNGQPIAIVLAETQEQADHARSLIRATYQTEPAKTDFATAKAAGLKPGNFRGENKVHITSPFVGGAFGCKSLWNHHVLAAAASSLQAGPSGFCSRAKVSIESSAGGPTPSRGW